MPKLGTRTVDIENGKYIEVTLHYFAVDKYKQEFFVVPPEKFIIREAALIENRYLRRIHYYGASGSTETEAIENLKKYLDWYHSEGVQKTYFILIEKTTKKKSWSWDNNENDDKTQAIINFSFKKAFILSGDKKYYEDTEYSEMNKKHNTSLYNAEERFTILPFSEEKLKACEMIVQQLHAIQDKISGLFADQKLAESTLERGFLLLDNAQ